MWSTSTGTTEPCTYQVSCFGSSQIFNRSWWACENATRRADVYAPLTVATEEEMEALLSAADEILPPVDSDPRMCSDCTETQLLYRCIRCCACVLLPPCHCHCRRCNRSDGTSAHSPASSKSRRYKKKPGKGTYSSCACIASLPQFAYSRSDRHSTSAGEIVTEKGETGEREMNTVQ